MLFRPKFCVNCGSRIERELWHPWTSRRFCETCEIEFKGQEWLLRVAVGITLLTGLVGIGAFWFAPARVPEVATTIKRERPETPPGRQADQPANQQSAARNAAASLAAIPTSRSAGSEQPSRPAPVPPATQQPVSVESVYHCGAETRKGTPCSRRVKEPNGRCYQHAGMPAMAQIDTTTAVKKR